MRNVLFLLKRNLAPSMKEKSHEEMIVIISYFQSKRYSDSMLKLFYLDLFSQFVK